MKFDFSYYSFTFYFSGICSLVATVIGYNYKNKFLELKLFYLYPFASFIQFFLFVTTTYLDADQKILDYIGIDGAKIFLLIEFSMIYYFFWHVILSIFKKRLLLALTFLYTILVFYSVIAGNYFFALPISLFNIHAIFILIPGLFHLFELFKIFPVHNLFNNPSFWITIGIVIYFYCTLPLFLMLDFLYNKNTQSTFLDLYSINFICYGILFLFTIKAYLCPKRETP